jgi:hypothetical protein
VLGQWLAMTQAQVKVGGVIARSSKLHPLHALKTREAQDAEVLIDEAETAKTGAKYFGSKWSIADDVDDNRVLAAHAFMGMPIVDSGLNEADMLLAIDSRKAQNAFDTDKITVCAFKVASTVAGPEIASCLLQIVRNPDEVVNFEIEGPMKS